MLVIAAVLLPALLLFTWMIWRSYANERSAIERQVVGEADALSRLVDSFVEKREAVLHTLVTSRGLEAGDLADFHERARRAVPGTTEWIVLVDEHGRMLVHTEHPYGTVLPDGAGEYLAVNAAGNTFFSNLLLRGPATGKSVLFIAIPVKIDGTVYSLHYVVTASVIGEILKSSPIASDRVATIVDRNNKVAARNRRMAEFLGASPPQAFQHARAAKDRGKLYDRSLEGIPSVVAYHTSPKTGWSAAVGAPSSDLFTPARHMLRVAVISLTIVTGFALTLAASLGSRLVSAVNTLVLGTKALATGDFSAVRDTGMNETDLVVRALRDAALQLRAREAELARSRDEALEASRVKDEFLATLSHELRTPLNPVLLLATDGAADPRHPADTRSMFAAIAKSVSLEARLIDDMLDVTRITRGKLSLDLREVELHEVLRDALSTVELDFSDKQLKIKTAFSSTPVWVSADSVRLQQVFWNLLKNAAKFSPAGGLVDIATRRLKDQRVEVSITDRGIGMTEEELARSFRRFEQGAHQLGGLGLGLAISKALVELHGGSLTAMSPGRNLGATFIARLPIVAAPAPSVSKIAPQISAANPALSSPILLLVEDHESTRMVLARLLNRRGYEVVPAGTMAEALALFPTREFSVIVSDIGLPDGDGCTLLQMVMAIRPIVAIAVSGYGMEDDVRRSQAAGFVDHLVKPVTIEALGRALNRAQQAMRQTSVIISASS
jgi:signal transduction histidine kinase/CheY-like chemotaxis protein